MVPFRRMEEQTMTPIHKNPDYMLSRPEFLKELREDYGMKCSVARLKAMCDAGLIRWKMDGRRIVIPRSQLKAFIR